MKTDEKVTEDKGLPCKNCGEKKEEYHFYNPYFNKIECALLADDGTRHFYEPIDEVKK